MAKSFFIGHGVYSGINAPAAAPSHATALRILLQRGIRMVDAQRALRNASQGSHATCSRYARMKSGSYCAVGTVEIVAAREA